VRLKNVGWGRANEEDCRGCGPPPDTPWLQGGVAPGCGEPPVRLVRPGRHGLLPVLRQWLHGTSHALQAVRCGPRSPETARGGACPEPEPPGVSVTPTLYVVGVLVPISLVLAVLPSALLLMLLLATITQLRIFERLGQTGDHPVVLWIALATWLASGVVILQGSHTVRALFYRGAVLSTLASWALLVLAGMVGGESATGIGWVAFLPAVACPIVAFVARPRRRSSSSGAP